MAADDKNPKPRTPASPWYADGLLFECVPDCGACCTNHDSYAYVYLEHGEPERIAGHLELPLEAFLERYTETDEEHRVLSMERPDCPFLEDARCTVYPVRPVQCRTFPFWRENLANRRSWSRLKRFCPGIDRGERHSLAVVRSRLDERKP